MPLTLSSRICAVLIVSFVRENGSCDPSELCCCACDSGGTGEFLDEEPPSVTVRLISSCHSRRKDASSPSNFTSSYTGISHLILKYYLEISASIPRLSHQILTGLKKELCSRFICIITRFQYPLPFIAYEQKSRFCNILK